jgi:hypothetical protein
MAKMIIGVLLLSLTAAALEEDEIPFSNFKNPSTLIVLGPKTYPGEMNFVTQLQPSE